MTPSKPYIVGLTGGIACGKSGVTAALRKAGAPVVDADEISRSLTAPGGTALPKIRRRFGDRVFSGDALNRLALADAVFGKPEELAALNDIMHPLVYERIEDEVAAYAQSPAVVLDIPLLYETGYEKQCDEVWCVWAPEAAQVSRLKARGLSESQAKLRVNSQVPALEKAKRAAHVLVTTGPKAETARLATMLWDELIARLAHE